MYQYVQWLPSQKLHITPWLKFSLQVTVFGILIFFLLVAPPFCVSENIYALTYITCLQSTHSDLPNCSNLWRHQTSWSELQTNSDLSTNVLLKLEGAGMKKLPLLMSLLPSCLLKILYVCPCTCCTESLYMIPMLQLNPRFRTGTKPIFQQGASSICSGCNSDLNFLLYSLQHCCSFVIQLNSLGSAVVTADLEEGKHYTYSRDVTKME